MNIEKVTLPGAPVWVRAVFYTVLMVGAWLLIGLMASFGSTAVTALAAPGMLVLLVAPLAMKLIIGGDEPRFFAMVAAGIALLVSSFTVPGDLYLGSVGERQEAVVTDVRCHRIKGRCAEEYALETPDNAAIPGHLHRGRHEVGDSVRVVTDPVGLLPPSPASAVGIDLFVLMAVAGWATWLFIVGQGVRETARSRARSRPASRE